MHFEVKEIHFSGHADYNGLQDFAAKADAEKTLLVHGEKEKMSDLKKAIEKRAKKEVLLPKLNETMELAD